MIEQFVLKTLASVQMFRKYRDVPVIYKGLGTSKEFVNLYDLNPICILRQRPYPNGVFSGPIIYAVNCIDLDNKTVELENICTNSTEIISLEDFLYPNTKRPQYLGRENELKKDVPSEEEIEAFEKLLQTTCIDDLIQQEEILKQEIREQITQEKAERALAQEA